jgi:pimeloyl-ACP methyl ester carboxylesterase
VRQPDKLWRLGLSPQIKLQVIANVHMRSKLLKLTGGIVVVIVAAALVVVVHANFRISEDEVLDAGANSPGRLLSVNGHRWHVVIRGKAVDPAVPPILFIHGFMVPGHESLLPWADSLGGKRMVILPDLLGYGYSDRIPEAGSHFTASSYAAGLANVLDQLGVARVDVVGHSYGGAIAARLALDYPDRVRKAIFMSSPIYYLEPSAGERIIGLPLGIGRAAAWHTMGGGPVSFSGLVCENRPATCMQPTRIKGTTDTVRAMMQTHRGAADNENLVRDLSRLTAKSLVVWGANDRIFPTTYGERLANGLHSEMTVIPNARHMPHQQQPVTTTKLVLEFLDAQ